MTPEPVLPDQPAPQPGLRERPRRRRRLWPVLVLIVLIGSGLAGAHLTGLVDLDPRPTPTPTATEAESVSLVEFFDTLTAALESQDRQAFFNHVQGAAVAPLSRWWDNMDAIGWTTGRIAPIPPSGTSVRGPDAQVRVLLGTDMRFGQYAPDTRGDPRRVIHGFEYELRVDVSGDEPVILEFTPLGERPWDSGPLTAVVGENVVVAALGGDRALLADLLEPAEQAAAWTMADHADQFGRQVPTDGFVVFVTGDSDRFRAWYGSADHRPDEWEPAGFAFTGASPGPEPWPEGALVAIGPSSFEFRPALASILVHEYAHVLQAIDHSPAIETPLLAIEGWAVHQELRYLEATSLGIGHWQAEVASCLGETPTLPDDADFRGPDAGCAYALAATVFAFAAEQGLAPAALADATAADGLSPFVAAAELGVPFTPTGWATWVAEAFAG